MSRDITTDPRDFGEHDESREPGSRMTLSQGRGGGSSENEAGPKKYSEETLAELRAHIDMAAKGKPSVSEFVDRLEREHVTPVASIQSDGRWNGMVYEYKGVRIKGSQLGRPYTAKGLQERRGLNYEPARDDERLGRIRMDRADRSSEPAPQSATAREIDPVTRVRGTDGFTPAERTVLNDVGRFRTVAVADLARARYSGRTSLAERDVNRLVSSGLLERRTIALDSRGRTGTYLALTRAGRKTLRQSASGNDQETYHGFVKPREIVHDAGVYRMFHAEAEKIEAEGGRVRRVVLDYELKKRAYSPLAKARELPPLEYAARQQEIAEENGLKVIDGHLVLPDLRIEYETAEGDTRSVDLELATRNYRAAHIRSKAAAGFRVYAEAKGGHLSAVLDKHDLIPELLGR